MLHLHFIVALSTSTANKRSRFTYWHGSLWCRYLSPGLEGTSWSCPLCLQVIINQRNPQNCCFESSTRTTTHFISSYQKVRYFSYCPFRRAEPVKFLPLRLFHRLIREIRLQTIFFLLIPHSFSNLTIPEWAPHPRKCTFVFLREMDAVIKTKASIYRWKKWVKKKKKRRGEGEAVKSHMFLALEHKVHQRTSHRDWTSQWAWAGVSNLFISRTGKPWTRSDHGQVHRPEATVDRKLRTGKLQSESDQHTAEQQPTLFYTQYKKRVGCHATVCQSLPSQYASHQPFTAQYQAVTRRLGISGHED